MLFAATIDGGARNLVQSGIVCTDHGSIEGARMLLQRRESGTIPMVGGQILVVDDVPQIAQIVAA